MTEIITLNIGGCGTNMGLTQLELYCLEHNIGKDGRLLDQDKEPERNQA